MHDFQNPIKYAAELQKQLYEKFKSRHYLNTRFSNMFEGSDEVDFFRQNKGSITSMASSYSEIPGQQIVQTKETFTLTHRYGGSILISNEDLKRVKNIPQAREQSAKSWSELFEELIDTGAKSQYSNAQMTIRDGDMITATNGGGTAAIIPTVANIFEITALVREKAEEQNLDTNQLWLEVSPRFFTFLSLSSHLTRATQFGDNVIRKGFTGKELDGIAIFSSNNCFNDGSADYFLFGQGQPIELATLIEPNVEWVSSSTQLTNFVNAWKVQTRFGIKTFTEGAQKLGNIKVAFAS